jgi:hypothetical protein
MFPFTIDTLQTLAIFGSAWLAVTSWAVFRWVPAWSRPLWTLGAAANLMHVLLALHFVYAWDQEQAYAAVARQTYEQTGFDSGIGLYINYAFTLLWLADALSWWLVPRRYARRSRSLDAALQFVFLFMFFNATVAFGKSPLRLFGIGLCLIGALGWFKPRQIIDKMTNS